MDNAIVKIFILRGSQQWLKLYLMNINTLTKLASQSASSQVKTFWLAQCSNNHSRVGDENLACHQLEPKTRPKRKWYIIKPFPHFGKSGNGFMLYHFRFLKKRKYYFRILKKTEMILWIMLYHFRFCYLIFKSVPIRQKTTE